MEIVKHGQLKFKPGKYYGICPSCGCEFTTIIDTAIGLNGDIWFRRTDSIEGLEYKQKDYICDCPECATRHVKLIETE